MTKRANHILDALLVHLAQRQMPGLTPDRLVQRLRAHDLRPSEVGWILHHTFGISMPEAVHLAEGVPVAPDRRELESAPPPESRREVIDAAGAVRLVVV